MDFQKIYSENKTIAVVGMSTKPEKPAYWVPKYMLDQGYKIIPVNPTVSQIDGIISYPSLLDIPEHIDIVNVFRRSEDCLAVVQEAVERKKQKGDVKIIWLQEDITNNEAGMLAEANGITFIQDKCMFKEHSRLG